MFETNVICFILIIFCISVLGCSGAFFLIPFSGKQVEKLAGASVTALWQQREEIKDGLKL